ncbi:Pleckstrin -like proteiny domain-containing family A member 5 [Channa argus]|uniref:Pleckstrin-like proteiny domain-containing family A member 5 n=1 Tax=Channa argus TaxID=215402 RepID=A0A6G1QIM8_CHAAH|nr:Pleckstrin -like proteiny domain-containing family A member 5 [Channa argus]
MCSFHLQTEKQCNEKSPACGIEHCNPSKTKGISIPVPDSHDGKQSYLSPFYMTRSNDNQGDEFAVSERCQRTNIICHRDLSQQNEDFNQRDSKDMESLDTDDCEYKVYHSEVADSGFDQTGDAEYCSPEPLTEELSHRAFAIQIIPPSCSGSEEQIPQSHPVILFQNNTSQGDSVPVSPKHRKSSVRTITVGVLEERFMQMDSRTSCSCMDKHIGTASDDPDISPSQDIDVHPSYSSEILEKNEPREYSEETENTSSSLPLNIEERNHLQLDKGGRARGDSVKSLVTTLCSAKGSTDAEINAIKLSKPDKAEKQIVPRSSLETKEHLKPALHKDPDSSGSDHWARRRKLFKETKQWSSAGGSSMTSDITEESVSEDTCSLDMTVQDMEDRGFYTESFHSSAWIFQGDNAGSEAVTATLNARTRVVSIRERTVKISKGTGEYPWGFRIQFSKPIVVTEVDTNGAAEEAGLLVGDYVLAVNGTDVTSIPHSEAANLARQGPDILTLTIGSDVARGPNTPRPACRGYLHKRTQSGLIKGWRKRWFVLKHDCCLYYYRHRRDEGKRRPLSAVKLEGAEVGKDSSLGKPFVFKCHPQSGNRMYYLCATSNQEMKRWLEAMEKAIHPITQVSSKSVRSQMGLCLLKTKNSAVPNHVWVDVTRHNANLPPLAVKNPECLGLLHKIDRNKDMWVQHYCILKDGCLYLYSGIRATRAHGGMYLQGYMVREQPYGSKKSTIELKPASDEFKTFYLCAENPNENKRKQSNQVSEDRVMTMFLFFTDGL